MTPEEVRQIIREELNNILKIDRYVFDKGIQILDGRNIQLGRTNGTKIGTATDQKIAFYGSTPVDKPDTISDPTDAGSSYNQSVAQSSVNTIKSLIDRLQELGLIA